MRNILKTSFCILISVAVSSSCKKDNTPTGGGPSQQTSLAKYNNVYGALIAGKVVDYYSSSFSDTSYQGAAVFYNTPQTNIIIGTANTTTVTSASLNNSPLYLYNLAPNAYIYADTVSNLNLSTTVNWQVQSTGVVPSFNQTTTINYPSYAGYTHLPDTINTGQDFILNTTGGLNADSLSIIVTSNGNNKYQTLNMAASTSSYTIAQSMLANLPVTSTGQLSISYEKILVQDINGKNIVFMKTLQFNKAVVIVSY